MVEFKNFSFQYDTQKNPTLKNINLKIMKGEKVLIVGLSGSGKSTLGNCINGLIPFVYTGKITGECLVGNENIEKLSISKLSKKVGTVLQDTDGQFVGLTVGEDIAFAMENDNIATTIMHKRVEKVANDLVISDLLTHAPSNLSGGQKQRVSLAGVLVDDVDILLFDEPLANLDPATGVSTIELIDEINKIENKTIIIIEHRLEDVLHCHVDRIILFDEGEIVADTTVDKLLSSNILLEKGIREPLYLSALKYAGVKVKEEAHPGYVESLLLSEEEKEKITNWVKKNKIVNKEEKEAIIKIESISYSYEGIKDNVSNVSFDINKGEMLAIIGKNGAGKSTIAHLLAGFMPLDKGNIYLNGRNIKDDTIFERGEKIGLVLQNPNQMICNTMIFDEVAFGLRNRGISEQEVKERVEEALKICGLYPFRRWPISALSYGQKKRVTIASIIVSKPDVLILDEPTAGQDYHHYTEIMSFLEELNKKGFTIVIITHDMHLMLEYCARAIVLLDGNKIFDGKCSEALNDEEIVSKANLKKTSLYALACDLGLDPIDVTNSYINAERKLRTNENEIV